MMHEYKKKVMARLSRMHGQLSGITNMVANDKYCADILTQVLALQGSLKGLAKTILESHLHTCGGPNLTSPNPETRKKFIKEIVRAFSLSLG